MPLDRPPSGWQQRYCSSPLRCSLPPSARGGSSERKGRHRPHADQPQPGRARRHVGRSQRRARRLPGHVEEVQRQVDFLQGRHHRRRGQRLPPRYVPHGDRPGRRRHIQGAGARPLPRHERQRRAERTLVRPSRSPKREKAGPIGAARPTRRASPRLWATAPPISASC